MIIMGLRLFEFIDVAWLWQTAPPIEKKIVMVHVERFANGINWFFLGTFFF